MGRGELYWPAGITIDTNDIVYVSEFNNGSCLCVYQ